LTTFQQELTEKRHEALLSTQPLTGRHEDLREAIRDGNCEHAVL
jgi:hypothetical protein